MQGHRRFFLFISSLSVFLAVSSGFAQQVKAKKIKSDDDLIERFSPDLNIQAKQQMRRLDGFKEQRDEHKSFDRNRENGENEYLEELLKWEEEREFGLRERKKELAINEKNQVLRDREQQQQRRDAELLEEEQNEGRKKYIVAREKIRAQSLRKFSEEEELKVFENRPRFDDKKRTLFGAKSKWGSGKGLGGSSGGGSGSSPSPQPSFDENSPPPAPADSGNMDYFPPPPPPPPMDDYNVPPPPPMDDFGNPQQGDMGFPPPPPPSDFNQGGY